MKLFSFIFLLYVIVGCSDSGEQSDQLIGTWKFQAFEDTADNVITPIPDNAEDILMVFGGSEFNGTTGRNTYKGTYTADSKNLTFLEFGTTEIGESDLGKKYADAFVAAYDNTSQQYLMSYSISDNTLKIKYSDSKNLIFERE